MTSSAREPPNDLYRNPDLWRWADSIEGLNEWPPPGAASGENAARFPWGRRGNEVFARLGALLPGVVIALALAAGGRIGSEALGAALLGLEQSPISPVLLAIAAGLLIRNTIGLPAVYEAGLQLCTKRVLRLGVALLGIRLSLGAVGAIGVLALPIALGCIATALLVMDWITRALGLSRRLGALVAVGTAICGNTAIVATAPAIGAKEEEISYAMGTITLFGLLALLGYPFLSHLLFAGDPTRAGLFLGTAIHDTAQVAGAGLLYLQHYGASEALDVATVTKLLRNLLMIAVIPLVASLYRRSSGSGATTRPSLREVVPLFVFGFVAMALLRTLGDWGAAPFGGLLSREQWERTTEFLSWLSSWCLVVAMASVGLATNLDRLRRLGVKPLAAGLAAAVAVGLMSVALIRALVPWMR